MDSLYNYFLDTILPIYFLLFRFYFFNSNCCKKNYLQ